MLDLEDKKMELLKKKNQIEIEKKEKENKMKLEYNINLIQNLKGKDMNLDLKLYQMIQAGNLNNNQKEINYQLPPPEPIYNQQMMFPPQPIYYPQMIYPPQLMNNFQQQLVTSGNPNINNSQMENTSNIPQQMNNSPINNFNFINNSLNYPLSNQQFNNSGDFQALEKGETSKDNSNE